MARGAAAMIPSQATIWAAALALTVAMPRALGAAGYGKLQLVLALVGVFSVLVEFGTTTLLTREIARADVATLGKAALAGTALAGGLWVGGRWGIVPALLLGMPLYAGLLLRLRVLSQEDLAFLVPRLAKR